MHSQPGQSCWLSLKSVHSLLNKEAAWLHYCIVVMSPVYKSRKFHLGCTNGCSFSLVLLSSSFFPHSFFLPLSLHSLFPFFLAVFSCEAQALRTGWTTVKGSGFFSPAKLNTCNSRNLPSDLNWRRFQQVWAGSRLAHSLAGDGVGLTSGNTKFLASGFQSSL